MNLFPGFFQAGEELKENKLLRASLAGAVVTAVCCFTPVLVILMGAAGLAAWTGKLDMILFPLLGVFLVVAAFAYFRKERV